MDYSVLGENRTNRSEFVDGTPPYLIKMYWVLLITSGSYLSLLALGTTVANGLLLLTIYKDSVQHFRKPVTILIAALATADVLNGLIIDPLHAYRYFSIYHKTITREQYHTITTIAMLVGAMTMNASYLIVLLLSAIQVIAVVFPYKHKTIVTTRSVSIATAVAIVYSIAFALSYVMGMPLKIFQMIEVLLHMTGLTVLLVIAYVCLQIFYKKQTRRVRRLFANRQSSIHNDDKSILGQRKFLLVNLLLIACLLVSTLPVTVVWYVMLFPYSKVTKTQVIIRRNVGLIVDNFLLLKFFIDPFIYAWRLPNYRSALKRTLAHVCPKVLPKTKLRANFTRSTRTTTTEQNNLNSRRFKLESCDRHDLCWVSQV